MEYQKFKPLIILGFIMGILLIILFVVVVNAILGVVQENKAEKSLEALKSMSAPFAKVMRNGEVSHIKSEEIVPADIRLMKATNRCWSKMTIGCFTNNSILCVILQIKMC